MAVMWTRKYIIVVYLMMRRLRPMMQADDFNTYINEWANILESGNPLFQRSGFIANCWKGEME